MTPNLGLSASTSQVLELQAGITRPGVHVWRTGPRLYERSLSAPSAEPQAPLSPHDWPYLPILLFQVYECFACMFVCTLYAYLVPCEASRGYLCSRNWS